MLNDVVEQYVQKCKTVTNHRPLKKLRELNNRDW